MPKQAVLNVRITAEEDAKIELLRRRLGMRNRATLLSYMVADRFEKLFGDIEAAPRLRSVLYAEKDALEAERERELANRPEPLPPMLPPPTRPEWMPGPDELDDVPVDEREDPDDD